MTLVAVAANKYARGFQPGQEDAPEAYEVVELEAALRRVYRSDAHLVAYVVDYAARQPRINKPGLASFGRRARVHAFFCDVDNVGHAAWTDETFAAARAQDLALGALSLAGVYYTRHGRRIVQPIAEPIDVAIVEPYLRRWLLELESAGLAVDWACRDWTRHFRLPNVPREPRGRSRCIDLDRLAPIAIAPLPDVALRASSPPPVGRARAAAPPAWTAALPDAYRPAAEAIARIVRDVTTEWHPLFLALAGALLRRGVPDEHVPAFCGAVSQATHADDRTAARIRDARSTVERHRAGLATTGYASLRDRWPAVADAVDFMLSRGAERRMRELVAGSAQGPPPATLAETTRRLEDAIRCAPDGLTVIAAACGLGKTRAAERVAAERARRPYATPDARGERAPAQSKTSIAVDKHTLALQVVGDLASVGAAAGRHFSPLALRDEEGAPVCRYHRVALPLVEGGQPMQWELCKGRNLHPCEHYTTCRAKDGYEGPENPRVHVGPHALVSALDAAAGSSGLLVIDEPPALLETLTFSLRDLEGALSTLDAFDGRYAAAMRPALEAVRGWIALGESAEVTTIAGVVATFESHVDPSVLAQARRSAGVEGDAIACARAAPVPEEGPPAPPLRFEQVPIARRNEAHARRLGQASRVLRAVHHALTSDTPVAARLVARGSAKVLHLTRVREAFARALRREGAVVVLDANADLWAPVYAKIVGYERPVQRFEADDGAPIERSILRLRSATRTTWQPRGALAIASSLRTAVRTAIEWALAGTRRDVLAIITLPLVRLALEGALAPEDGTIDTRWRDARQEPAVLADARATLGPHLRRWPGRILLGHYGALRGLDAMAEADVLVTLGDPWVNLGDVKNECAFLGLADWEERYEALCRAELEQAHGRLRTVHRTRPGRALHVGAVVPGGRAWSEGAVHVHAVGPGRAKNPDRETRSLPALLQALGSVTKLADAIGCDRKTIRRYLTGERAPTDAVERQAAAMLAKLSLDIPRESSGAGGGPKCLDKI